MSLDAKPCKNRMLCDKFFCFFKFLQKCIEKSCIFTNNMNIVLKFDV